MLSGLYLLVVFLSTSFAPDNPENPLSALEDAARTIEQSPALIHGEWGFTVMDVASKSILLDVNGDKSLAPASNLKLFTTATALKTLGPSHRFQTVLGYSGKIANGILTGDLVIVGGGDPTLGSTQVTGTPGMDQILEQWKKVIRDAGIKTVTGDVVADISYFDSKMIPDDWLWVDIGNYYGAGPSALCFHDNLYYLYFKPDKRVGMPARVLETDPRIDDLEFENYMRTGTVGSGDNGYIYGGPKQRHRVLRGTIPAGVSRFSIKGSLPDPALFCAQTLHDFLIKNGITIEGSPKISYQPVPLSNQLITIQSQPLHEIIYWINKESINLYTEVLLKHIGRFCYNEGSFGAGIRAVKDFLSDMDIPLDGLHLSDGSGLSPLDAITTHQMVSLLQMMANDSTFTYFYNSLPIAGVASDDGHLGHFCRGTEAANNLRAKTGSISRVRSHSGYVHNRSGQLLCFSMIANDYEGNWRTIDKMHERIMILLARME